MWWSDDLQAWVSLCDKNEVGGVGRALIKELDSRGNARITRSRVWVTSTKFVLDDGIELWPVVKPGVIAVYDRGKNRGAPLAELRTAEDAEKLVARLSNPFTATKYRRRRRAA